MKSTLWPPDNHSPSHPGFNSHCQSFQPGLLQPQSSATLTGSTTSKTSSKSSQKPRDRTCEVNTVRVWGTWLSSTSGTPSRPYQRQSWERTSKALDTANLKGGTCLRRVKRSLTGGINSQSISISVTLVRNVKTQRFQSLKWSLTEYVRISETRSRSRE